MASLFNKSKRSKPKSNPSTSSKPTKKQMMSNSTETLETESSKKTKNLFERMISSE